MFGFSTDEAFRDLQVINLDGLPETEALKLVRAETVSSTPRPPDDGAKLMPHAGP